jgi:predicted butyrate kinase (DUF1464 family)
LDDGRVVHDLSLDTGELAESPGALVEALLKMGPLDLVYGPSGYGLPLTPVSRVGERELSLMALVRADEASRDVGIGGLRRLIRALAAAGLPLVFGPGVVHLPTVPAHRKWNRIDMGTADKVCAAALCVHEQATRLGIAHGETSFVMLELGGAFTAALAISRGRVVDGLGGSSGPLGARAAGALDAEAAYLLASTLSKETVFSGGALAAGEAVDGLAPDGRPPGAWLALVEGAAKAALALSVAVPQPREVLVTGRLGADPATAAELSRRLSRLAPVRVVEGLGTRAKPAAQGAALLADGLAGGRFASLVETMELRAASGTVLDHLRLRGADRIRLG